MLTAEDLPRIPPAERTRTSLERASAEGELRNPATGGLDSESLPSGVSKRFLGLRTPPLSDDSAQRQQTRAEQNHRTGLRNRGR